MRRATITVYAAAMAAGLAVAGPAWAQGAPVQPEVFRFAAPPPGFDASTASDAERARYGLPPMPNPFAGNRLAYTSWVRAMRAARHFTAPQVRRDGHRHGPATSVTQIKEGALTSNNWVARALEGAATSYGGSSFTETMGQWVVSAVLQGDNQCFSTPYYSATWVGMDGLTSASTDVSQAGTESDAVCQMGINVQSDYAWFEWYPADGFEITNFPVLRGASIFVVVQATSATTANATFVNLQTGNYTVAGFSATLGTRLIGNSVEWVVERPTVNNVVGTLANFGEIPMESEIAYTVSQVGTSSFSVPGVPSPGQVTETVTMQLPSGTTIATIVPEGPSAQLAQVAGPTQ